jgi:hypothetical protein
MSRIQKVAALAVAVVVAEAAVSHRVMKTVPSKMRMRILIHQRALLMKVPKVLLIAAAAAVVQVEMALLPEK